MCDICFKTILLYTEIMNTSLTILVFILGVTLLIFLLLSIVLVIKLIQFVRNLKDVSVTAKNVVGDVESAAALFRKTAAPIAFSKFVMNVADLVMSHKTKKEKK